MRPSPVSAEGWTVARRLFFLVLFPLTVLTLTIGVLAQDRWEQRQAAADVVSRVDQLRALVSAQSAVYDERAAVELQVRSASFGVPATLGGGLLGVPEPSEVYGASDAALAVAANVVPEAESLLVVARQRYLADEPGAIAAYDALDDELVEAIVFEVSRMRDIGLKTADADLSRVLRQLEASALAFSASTDQATGLADSWFGSEDSREVSLSRLGFQTARYELAIAEIDATRLPADLRQSIIDRGDPVSVAVIRLLAGDLTTPQTGNVLSELPLVIGVFESSFARNDLLASLVAESSGEVEVTASRIADDASDAFIAAILLGGFAVGASILLSWRLALSIVAPMASVATRTRALQSGQIESEPLPLEGPRELRNVAGAINDVTVNLEALEGKLEALSRGDLDDEVLTTPLPGRLGETLSKSVDTLSTSIADRRNLQARLGFQANHDPLTGLANRAAVLDRLSDRLANAADAAVGLLFVDLDDFKRANDVFGHGTGDRVLMEVAERLRTMSRPTDLAARLGGDEFLIVLDDVQDIASLTAIAHRIVEAIAHPMALTGTGGLTVHASVGVALTDDDTMDALDFLAHADAALFRAKASDRRVGVFDDELLAKIRWRSTIEQRLRRALAEGNLEVHYQPVLASGSLEVGQLEALVRWVEEDSYGPDDFIPVAEASDLIIEIDRFVLEAATSELAAILEENPAERMSVAVNLSGRHLLHADVARHVSEALQRSGLDASRLIIEVTETALIADLDRAALHLTELRDLGVRTSVDDFGTGFTSISQLRRLPIDELKIDRSLVEDLPGDQTLVRVVRDLAEHFGLTTVAEGVETQQQADFLRDLGCSQLQGWLYARAMAPADLRSWLSQRNELARPDRVANPDLT